MVDHKQNSQQLLMSMVRALVRSPTKSAPVPMLPSLDIFERPSSVTSLVEDSQVVNVP